MVVASRRFFQTMLKLSGSGFRVLQHPKPPTNLQARAIAGIPQHYKNRVEQGILPASVPQKNLIEQEAKHNFTKGLLF